MSSDPAHIHHQHSRALWACLALGAVLFVAQAAGANIDEHGDDTVRLHCVNPDGGKTVPCGDATNPLTVNANVSTGANVPVETDATTLPDGGAGNCFGTGGPPLVGRTYVRIKSKDLNTGSPVLCFTTDGSTPVCAPGSSAHGYTVPVGGFEELSPMPASNVLTCSSYGGSVLLLIKEQ